MLPAFTKALYYPSIDIENLEWIKTAVLFWDSISTIVPESINNPYRSNESEYLADIGFLTPFYINSNDTSVIDIEDEIIELMYTPEFINGLFSRHNMRTYGVYNEKMSYRLREMLERGDVYGREMRFKLREHFMGFGRNFYHDGVFYLEDSFAYLYMVTLANKICENHAIALVTDNVQSESITKSIRYDNQVSLVPDNDLFRRHRNNVRLRRERHCEQGILLDLIINGLKISPDTSLHDIMEFKKRHQDELGLFRTELAKLTQSVSSDMPVDALRQRINDIYENEFKPAYNNFQRALESSRIKWFADNFLKVSLFSTGATSVPMAALGMAVPQALLAGAGVSLLASAISYNIDKQQKLRENPYSYLLAVENGVY